MNNNEHSASKNVLPWHLSWLTVILALLAIGTFIAISGGVREYPVSGVVMESSTGSGIAYPTDARADKAVPPSRGIANEYYPYPYPSPDVPVTDIREFVKVYYSAVMRSRDVQGLERRVETTVRGYGGRIDQQTISPKYGYVSFSLPQSKYDAFRTELEGFVGSRFLTINISSQNLLPQKVSIEQQQKQAETNLADAKSARQKLVSAHASAVQSLEAGIDADATAIAALSAQTATPQILAQIQAILEDQSSLKQQLVNENASYASQLSNADANIKYAQDWQKAVQTQDQTLLDNVATVTGTISIQWISFWGIALLYLPGYWIPAIFTALAVLSYLRDRRRAIYS